MIAKRALTASQLHYQDLMNKNAVSHPIVIAVGQAGSAKTHLACKASIGKLLNKQVKKIIITRPAVCVDEAHGFLPGDINEKMAPYVKPIYDCFLEYITMDTLKSHIKNEIIEICPLSYMRGRTFNNCFIVCDEMQNGTQRQLHTMLTRIGENCKTVITGDLTQCDLKLVGHEQNGLADLIDRVERSFEYSDESCIDIVRFTEDDIIRSDVVKKIVTLYSI